MDEKKHTRSLVLARRDTIPSTEREMRSRALCERLLKEALSALPSCATIAVYSAMKSEIDLGYFSEEAQRLGFRICYPCMVQSADDPSCKDDFSHKDVPSRKDAPSRKGIMEFYALAEHMQNSDATDTPAFLLHPARVFPANDPVLSGCTHVPYADLDAVLVPMVAFDDGLNRLGYGGGNYDRLLSQAQTSAYIAGVAFEEQRIERVPIEPHDLPLPRIFVG